MTDTWFLVADAVNDGGFYVLRMDRATLPKATVMSGPWISRVTAERMAAQMKETGSA